MLAQGLRHAWHQPAAAAGLQACRTPSGACTLKTIQGKFVHAQYFGSSNIIAAPSLNWTRRKRSAVEVAAGDGAQSAEVSQRLKAIALASEPEDSIDIGHSAVVSVITTGKTAYGAVSSDIGNTVPNGSARRHKELPIGAFQKLPQVQVASEQLTSAIRKAQRLGASKTIRNEAAKARNRAARQMDAAMKAMSVPLTGYIKGFPPIAQLHPFERALLDLTIGEGHYTTTLFRVDSLRKRLIQLGKEFAARSARAASKKDAVTAAEEGFAALEALFLKHSAAVDDLVGVARQLRRLPLVDPFLPTVALVGAPNVGKSSLVALLSSGAPEVCDYPFTTRSIKMGHFFVSGRRHQVTDTPGLLRRPEDERNGMERLTLAALAYLPTAAVFVTDLTGDCGTSVADQWAIRQHLRERFPTKLWLDVLSKADLLDGEFHAAEALTASGNARLHDWEAPPSEAATPAPDTAVARASGENPQVVALPVEGAVSAAAAQDTVVRSPAVSQADSESASSSGASGRVYRWGSGSGSTDVDGRQLAGAIGAVDAVQVAAALPDALRASATTGDGIEGLQSAVVQLLSEQAFAQQLATGRGPTNESDEQDVISPSRGTARILDRGMLAVSAP